MFAGNTRAVLFDAVGTLIFPDPPVAEIYHREAQKLGCHYSVHEIACRFRAAIMRHPQEGQTSERQERERWRRIVYDVIDDVEDSQELLLSTLWQHFGSASSWRLFEDVAPTWHELSRRGYLLGIASNFDSRLRTICRDLPALCECRHIFVSSEIGAPKPELQFYRAVEEQLGLRSEQILLIGDDHAADVTGPLAAGWQALWLRRDEEATDLNTTSMRSLLCLSAG
ncbi:MAG: HAD-IA family hydrolase [Pirellulaceae bacterium]|nr:HAD-IA family hydrolase [Pirellulaceae bacterium]